MRRTPSRTTFVRICMRCRVLLGVAYGPASDRAVAVSHGLCDACYAAGEAAMAARERGRR